MDLSAREVTFALVALVGLSITGYFNVQFVLQEGAVDVVAFLEHGFANPASSSLTADVLVAFGAFAVWAPVEANRLGLKHGWVYVALGLITALAFALPVFLLVRERRLARLEAVA